ncbi:MAG: cytochrome c oxidase subunit 3 [Desulfobacterium sp.]|nr:cytochrome c oxidase subunit 3 [Desulfobacterium sp.]
MGSHHDTVGARTGMWLFLYTEIMLFGGLFVLYSAYYRMHAQAFISTGQELDTVLGSVNTVILLVSSFLVAAAITAVQRSQTKGAMALLTGAVLLGMVFLANKYLEWGHKFHLGIYPGSPGLEDSPPGRIVFYGLYYTITGLHALHIVMGMVLLIVCIAMIGFGRIQKERFLLLENCGLYWHLVDLIWIFIFPLFYLIL